MIHLYIEAHANAKHKSIYCTNPHKVQHNKKKGKNDGSNIQRRTFQRTSCSLKGDSIMVGDVRDIPKKGHSLYIQHSCMKKIGIWQLVKTECVTNIFCFYLCCQFFSLNQSMVFMNGSCMAWMVLVINWLTRSIFCAMLNTDKTTMLKKKKKIRRYNFVNNILWSQFSQKERRMKVNLSLSFHLFSQICYISTKCLSWTWHYYLK